MTVQIESTPEFVRNTYAKMQKRLDVVRKRLGRPMTLAEKILYGHLADPEGADLTRGKAYLDLAPDRITMQDATAQMAMLQFLTTGKAETAVPTTIHADHLIAAKEGAGPDMAVANTTNAEVYDFLRTSAAQTGCGFWKPGAGIIHQVALEQYGFPGQMLIGTDSHTPNGGGLCQWASGVGGADAVDVMAGFPWEVLHPKIIGVKLTGKLSGWSAPKDVILKLCGILTVKGGTNAVIEFFGDGCESISATGKCTITNMGAEHGATTSVFPHDERMNIYLRSTARAELADIADEHHDMLVADPEVLAAPEKFYDQVIHIDLDTLEPHLVGPHTPDLARPVSEMRAAVAKEGYPDEVSSSLIGSCTNSSYEDMVRTVDVAQQALAHGLKAQTPLLITPGSEQVHLTIQRDGIMEKLNASGATVLANACGPCIGQWNRPSSDNAEVNTIVTSYNRNFPKRNDGSAKTMAFIGSPEIVMAYALSGSLSFNPLVDELEVDGKKFKLSPPQPAPEVPEGGFVPDPNGYLAPPADASAAPEVVVAPDSERLQLLSPFPARETSQLVDMPLLLKAKGKCTTDHISQAGPWLKFRGHLDNISDNCYIGANSAFNDIVGGRKDEADGQVKLYPAIARRYKAEGITWCVVGDENFGEGSSREHAAMEPRHLGCGMIITRSFARIHETNLKKQGILPLNFVNPADYDLIREDDKITADVSDLETGKNVTVTLKHADGTTDSFEGKHSMSPDQIKWFWAGSALNLLRNQ